MATYDYSCEKCKEVFEIVHPMSEVGKERRCEKCQSILKQEITGFRFSLKGNGWYSDGYDKGGS